jgi:hypothetical protein
MKVSMNMDNVTIKEAYDILQWAAIVEEWKGLTQEQKMQKIYGEKYGRK